jgi:pimeloyl-ACP methyl ester carboxylesterase
MTSLLLAALGAAVVVLALFANARSYVRRAEARWPPLGRFIDVDGVRVHVTEAGPADAPPLLLIHGASANLRELWGPLAPLIGEFRVIAYDRPGMGHSARPRRGAETLAAQARIAAAVLAASADSPAILVGHSLGAAVALRVALDHPELVAGVAAIAPASHPYAGDNVWWARLSAAPLLGPLFCATIIPAIGPLVAAGGVANNFAPASAPADYFEDGGVGLIFRPMAFRASALDVIATKREFAAQAPRYPEILAPVVVVTGEKDRIVSPKRHARTLAADLPAAELVIAPGAGHMPHRVRPDLVIAAIRRVAALAHASADG